MTVEDLVAEIRAAISEQPGVPYALRRLEKNGYAANDLLRAKLRDGTEPDRVAEAIAQRKQLDHKRHEARSELRKLAAVLSSAANKQRELRSTLLRWLDAEWPLGSNSEAGRSVLRRHGVPASEFFARLDADSDSLETRALILKEILGCASAPAKSADLGAAILFGYEHELVPPRVSPSASRTQLKAFLRACKKAHRGKVYNGFYDNVATVYSAIGDRITPDAVKKLSARSRDTR